MRLRPGDVVHGKYRLTRPLGDGGMGTIFEARHEVLGTRLALKFLHPELARRPGLVARFLQEARVSATLRSPHIVHVSDMEQGGQGVFLVMELLEGETLQSVIDRRRKLEVLVALDVTLQMLAGLEVAHRAGVVHRDLKPDNVFLVTTPEGILVKLLDFGIAKLKAAPEFQRGLTRPGVVMGTPEYMAPEQAFSADAVDPRADLYALGVLLFEMLSGQRPVAGDDARSIALHVTRGHVTPLQSLEPTLPAGLVAAIHRAMAPDPSHRFANAAEMRKALLPFAQALSPVARRSIPDLAAAEAAWTSASTALRLTNGATGLPAPSIVYGELMAPAGRPSERPLPAQAEPAAGYGAALNGAGPSTARGWPPGNHAEPTTARGWPPANGAQPASVRGWQPAGGAQPPPSGRAWQPANGAEPSTARGWPPASKHEPPQDPASAKVLSVPQSLGTGPALASNAMSNTQPPGGPQQPPPRPDATAPRAPMPNAFAGSPYGPNPQGGGGNPPYAPTQGVPGGSPAYGANAGPHGGGAGWHGSQGSDPNAGPGATSLAPTYGQGPEPPRGQTTVAPVPLGGPMTGYGAGPSQYSYNAGPSQQGYGTPPPYGTSYPAGSSQGIPSPAGWTQPPARARRRSSSVSLWVVALLATLVGSGVVMALTLLNGDSGPSSPPPSYPTPAAPPTPYPTNTAPTPTNPVQPPIVPPLPPTAPPTAVTARPPTTARPPVGTGGAGGAVPPGTGVGGAGPQPTATTPGGFPPFPAGLPSGLPTALPTALPSSLPPLPIPLPFPGFPQAPSGQQ
jgi:eukaryotic-like serine/threonine-protein kinase